MSDLARKSLCDLIKQYGPSLGNDPKRCEGLLKDYCGEEKREILLIVNAAKEGIPEGLSGSQTNMPRELLIRNLIDRLQNNVGIEEKYAHWAVESWALALGVEFPEISLKSNESSTPIPPKSPIAPPETPIVPTPKKGLNWKLVVGLGAIVSIITIGFSLSFNNRNPKISLPDPDYKSTPTPSPTTTYKPYQPKGDYKQLQLFLQANDLENADLETFKVMLKVAGKESEKNGYFDIEEWKNFPCSELIVIDVLWNKVSSKYGFKYQSKKRTEKEWELSKLGWNDLKVERIDTNLGFSFRYIKYGNPIKLVPNSEISLPIALQWPDRKDRRFDIFTDKCNLDRIDY